MSRFNLLFIAIFLGLLIWVSFFQADRVNRIQRGTMTIFSPFTKASGKISQSTSKVSGEKLSYAQLKESLDLIRSERDRLRIEVLQLDELIYDNNELRNALQYKMRSPLSLLPARVMNRKPLTWYNTLIIDKGQKDLVVPDLPVIVALGNNAGLVGKVTDVIGPHSSVVLLLTDEMCQVAAQIKGTQEQGILNGQRAPVQSHPLLKLRFLAKEAKIKPGDVIISSGLGEVFQKDLILGTVTEAKRGVIDTEATVQPAVDFEKLLDVFVIMPNNRAPSSNLTTEKDSVESALRASRER